jgi:hypothetical protein
MAAVTAPVRVCLSHASIAESPATREPFETTLLELVRAVDSVADNEDEVVTTVLYMIRSGSVRLRGNFRGSLLEDA